MSEPGSPGTGVRPVQQDHARLGRFRLDDDVRGPEVVVAQHNRQTSQPVQVRRGAGEQSSCRGVHLRGRDLPERRAGVPLGVVEPLAAAQARGDPLRQRVRGPRRARPWDSPAGQGRTVRAAQPVSGCAQVLVGEVVVMAPLDVLEEQHDTIGAVDPAQQAGHPDPGWQQVHHPPGEHVRLTAPEREAGLVERVALHPAAHVRRRCPDPLGHTSPPRPAHPPQPSGRGQHRHVAQPLSRPLPARLAQPVGDRVQVRSREGQRPRVHAFRLTHRAIVWRTTNAAQQADARGPSRRRPSLRYPAAHDEPRLVGHGWRSPRS